MKRIFFSMAMLTGLHLSAQTLFTYGTHPVTRQEFLRQFNRNLNPAEDKTKALEEYLPLYIHYKLKVQDAYDQRLDTVFTQKAELAEFRQQIEDNYFSQEANLNDLVREAAVRSLKDIQLQDIYIGFNPADPKSAEEAAARAEQAYQQLKAGSPYEKVLADYTTDADLKAAGGHLGWITAFSLPYRIENEVYRLTGNSYTQPLRTRSAYHVFRKLAERKALGKIRVAQILFPYPPQAAPETKLALQQQADSVYRQVQAGADFGQLAAQVSYDKTSYQNGGQLAPFGIGTYEKPFEDAAFALTPKEALSKPFTTSYGVHILKLLERIPVSDTAAALDDAGLRQRVATDNRMLQAKENLAKSLLPRIGYQPSKLITKQQLWKYTDSSLAGSKTPAKGLSDQTELFRYAKQPVRAGDWIRFVRSMRASGGAAGNSDYDALMNQYLNVTAAEYYKKHLEDYNTDFRNQVQEFKDANLNFEVTQKRVWDKAAADSTGLLRYYGSNKARYQWGPSVNAILITGTDQQAAGTARQQLEAGITNWRKVVNSMETRLLADSNRFEQAQIPVTQTGGSRFQPGTFTPMVLNPQDSSMTFCYIIDVIDQPGQRNFEEARGFVLNDYQQVLETQWLATLKKKYPVKVNTAVWNELLKK